MTGYLLDTNVPSEVFRDRPSSQVTRWLLDQEPASLFISLITLAELTQGITGQPDPHQRQALQRWLDSKIKPWFADRVLPVTPATGERCGRLIGEQKRLGRTLSFPDAAIAATALEHQLSVVTRNLRDFTGLGLTLVDPWTPEPDRRRVV